MEWTVTHPVTLEDAASIAQFQVLMAKETESVELDLSVVNRGVEQAMADPEIKGRYFIAKTIEGKVVGSLFVTREWSDWHSTWYWWIQSVYVRPDSRRQGAYRALYETVKRLAHEAGAPCVRLYVDRSNQQGLSTYQSLGMTESHYLLYEEDV